MQRSPISRRHALIGLAVAPGAALGAPGGLPSAAHADSSPEWDRLREKLFGGKLIAAGQGVVQITAPLRAAYGASVPIKVQSKLPQRADLYVRRMHLVIDKNPSPIAARNILFPRSASSASIRLFGNAAALVS